MKLKYVNPFKMDEGGDPCLTLGKEYEVIEGRRRDSDIHIIDDVGSPHWFDHPDYPFEDDDFKLSDYFEVIN